ncbi:MAG: hypothetical protein OJF52_004527 [Nitrospira sp.]|jgi:hypothetical protein|nr:MAG: hypothetical protein OJF52_004527 [Nitrospira sp.]
MSSRKPAVALDSLEPLILVIRGCRVILDTDLARLYGVPTFRFNEAVKRNSRRFPEDFMFQLTGDELAGLTSHIAISKPGRGGRRTRPYAFTEYGAVMAANILRSDRAVQMSVFVVRAFVRLREHIAANQAILKRLGEIDRTLLEHDSALLDLYEKLLPLLQPPPDLPKRRIGFHSKGKA